MNKDNCLLKDDILKFLIDNNKGISDSDIAKAIGRELFEVGFAVEELSEDGLVKLIPITTKSERLNEYIVQIIDKGVYFLRFNSFIDQYNTGRTKYNWMIAKTIANTLNAAAIIFIAIIGLYFNYSNLEYKQVNSNLNKRLNELELQINGIKEHSLKIKQDSIITQVN